jgi:hypothetical protein
VNAMFFFIKGIDRMNNDILYEGRIFPVITKDPVQLMVVIITFTTAIIDDLSCTLMNVLFPQPSAFLNVASKTSVKHL